MKIENAGPEIVSTDYWESDRARGGYCFLSTNAGAFRLLVPASKAEDLSEMRAAKGCAVSRGPWPGGRLTDAIEILFDDGSDFPFAMHLSIPQVDRLPEKRDAGRRVVLSLWTEESGRTVKLGEWPCTYRLAKALPDLRPWENRK